ncbi:RraA family protein [Jiangella asiatica]|uniref:Putative 4-hydroxy-4-methyl-2-oxoglutarate aldolase n=1 Tax=Jiangella asiatica TaxID=2530372 RepID=A0A4R5DJB0_9ACTN|nr:RraA family protein [Jiangella asiatica]TDE14222.1 RraA family protein [Jiangella asiatica]
MTTSPRASGDPVSRRQLAASLTCADIVDALGRRHRHRAHLRNLTSPTPGRNLFGQAITISYFPSCSTCLAPATHTFGALFEQAIGTDGTDKVLVLASNGYTETSVGGGTKLVRLEHHRLAGLLTDARLRDFTELSEYSFAAYCSGETPRAGGEEITPYQANVPVVLRGGVGVHPGQYIFADASGAVVIPELDIDDVLSSALEIRAQDAHTREQLAADHRAAVEASRRCS